MVLRLDNYCLGKKTVVYVDNQEDFDQCVKQNLNVIYRNSRETLTFWPEQIEFKINNRYLSFLQKIHSRDVFLVGENGRAYRSFDVNAGDNLIFVTPQCNSNCRMCPESDAERRLKESQSVSEIVDMIRYFPAYIEHITISGGEPFLPGDAFFNILAALKDKAPETEYLLLTNGRALAYSPFMDLFKKTAPKYMLLGIPIHGYDSISHDFITRAPGSFIQTFWAIKKLLKYRFSVEIRIVVSKLNENYLDKIADLIINEFSSVSSVKIMGLEMIGNAAINLDAVWIPYTEAFLASKSSIDKLIKSGINVALYNFPLCSVPRKYHYLCMKSISEHKIRFAEICGNCKRKDDCGGIFAGTIRLAKKDCIPIV